MLPPVLDLLVSLVLLGFGSLSGHDITHCNQEQVSEGRYVMGYEVEYKNMTYK